MEVSIVMGVPPYRWMVKEKTICIKGEIGEILMTNFIRVNHPALTWSLLVVVHTFPRKNQPRKTKNPRNWKEMLKKPVQTQMETQPHII